MSRRTVFSAGLLIYRKGPRVCRLVCGCMLLLAGMRCLMGHALAAAPDTDGPSCVWRMGCLMGHAFASEEAPEDGEQMLSEWMGQLDFAALEEMMPETNEEVRFADLVTALARGKGHRFEILLRFACRQLAEGMRLESVYFARVLVAIVLAGLMMTMGESLGGAGRTGALISISYLSWLMLQGYIEAANLTAEGIYRSLKCMSALVPVYLSSVFLSTGEMTVSAFYMVYLVVITVSQMLVQNTLVPLVHLYVTMGLCGQLGMEKHMSGLWSLLDGILSWGRKMLIVIATGFSVVQGILAPGIDNLRRSAVTKTLSAIPGVGGIFTGVTETMFGAGIVLKNSVGLAGCVLLLFVFGQPVIRLFFFSLVFRLLHAIAGLLGQERLAGCLQVAVRAIGHLLGLLLAVMLSLLISILVLAAATSGQG